MTPDSVLIQGDGIAACCCARLLRANGFEVALAKTVRSKLPTILVSESTQLLLRDVFEDRDLFRGFPQIRKRIVSWGRQSRTQTIPHSAVAVSEEELLTRLWPKVPACIDVEEKDPGWTIVTSRASDLLPYDCKFGSRNAFAISVRLKSGADRDACWVESLDSGWLFLLACGHENAFLLSIGASAEVQLEKSRLVEMQIESLNGPATQFPAYPRILSALYGPGWLACLPRWPSTRCAAKAPRTPFVKRFLRPQLCVRCRKVLRRKMFSPIILPASRQDSYATLKRAAIFMSAGIPGRSGSQNLNYLNKGLNGCRSGSIVARNPVIV